MKTNDIRRLKEDRLQPLLTGNEDLTLAGKVSKDSINFLTRQIRAIETFIETKLEIMRDQTDFAPGKIFT